MHRISKCALLSNSKKKKINRENPKLKVREVVYGIKAECPIGILMVWNETGEREAKPESLLAIQPPMWAAEAKKAITRNIVIR